MSKKTQPGESAAFAKFPGLTKSSDIVDQTNKIADIVKSNQQYPNTPAMQQAVTAWQASATNVQKNDQDIKSARISLVALIAARGPLVADWKRATKSTIAVVDQTAAGSAKAIKDWGFDIVSRTPAAPSADPPTGLRVTYDKETNPVVRWKAVPGHKGYNLQIGDGSATGWGPVVQVTRSLYKPTGLLPGQHIAVRVAVQRNTGVSGYSDVLNVVIR